MSKTATWIALLRGVNVGGRNKLPMASLVPELEKMGLSPMQSYLPERESGFLRLRFLRPDPCRDGR
ncbi:DUF1697 domain-containing protein [Verrucomicrobium sp. 3C]|uniref:DUF1697 domain-containing protein n=1 Tax=Verrucomicrobium sp. 3C TaxID=1134055 RepID=UPI0003A73D69|nr:DUF1697 domain-containing protein [Verrucomicrobium sp. 3C]